MIWHTYTVKGLAGAFDRSKTVQVFATCVSEARRLALVQLDEIVSVEIKQPKRNKA